MVNTRDRADIELASKWHVSRVLAALQQDNRRDLVAFIHDRYHERFFRPIQFLKGSKGETYGFAIMALYSLLIETLQCYREGWPSTNERELQRCKKLGESLRGDYRLDDLPPHYKGLGKHAFRVFFDLNRELFPGVDGEKFYGNIRNGLLHQAQTKGGWRIKIYEGKLWDERRLVIDRNLFVCALEAAFNKYLEELRANTTATEKLWRKARRKIFGSSNLANSRADFHCSPLIALMPTGISTSYGAGRGAGPTVG
jgi:hypothetical protein